TSRATGHRPRIKRVDPRPNPSPSWWPMSASDRNAMVNELLRPLDATHSQHRLAALLDSVMAISAGLELSEVLDRIVKVACELLGARYGALGVLGSDGKHLAEFITQGITPQEREDIGGLPRGHGVLGLLIRDPRPRRSQDIADDPDAFGFPPNHPSMRSFIGVPIRVRDQVFGNLYLAEKQDQVEFSEEDEAILVALATAAGIAIDNARRYEQSRRRRRWAETSAEMTQFLLEGREEASALAVVASRVLDLTQ